MVLAREAVREACHSFFCMPGYSALPHSEHRHDLRRIRSASVSVILVAHPAE